jgi:hypothetical protein
LNIKKVNFVIGAISCDLNPPSNSQTSPAIKPLGCSCAKKQRETADDPFQNKRQSGLGISIQN